MRHSGIRSTWWQIQNQVLALACGWLLKYRRLATIEKCVSFAYERSVDEEHNTGMRMLTGVESAHRG